jgi:hypothetical protein
MNSGRAAAISGVAIVVAVAAVVIAVLSTRGDSSEAQSGVYVFDGSQPGATAKPFDSEPDAVAAASKLAGFDVRVPSYLPEKWEVTGINIGPKPLAGSDLRTATVTMRHGAAGATLIEANQSYGEYGEPKSAGLTAPFPGGQFSSYLTSTTKNWKLVSDTRAFTLTVPVATPIDDVEAAKILGSLKAQ